jgi:hypothetical protein
MFKSALVSYRVILRQTREKTENVSDNKISIFLVCLWITAKVGNLKSIHMLWRNLTLLEPEFVFPFIFWFWI